MSFKDALTGHSRIFTADGDKAQTSSSKEDSTGMAEPGSKAAGSVAESLSQLIITHRLNGNNYLQWSRNLLMFVRGRKKEKYLTWDPKPPESADPLYETWCAENNTVMTWLIHSMNPEISENYLLASSAREIWESAKRTYSVKDNTAAILQVKRALRNLSQRELSVTQYYSSLVRLWQQIDLYDVHSWTCHTDALYFKQVIEKDRCYDFLLGLNDTFEDIRGRVMGIKPLPTLEDAFNIIRNEESRKALMQNLITAPVMESSAMVVHNNAGAETKGKKFLKCDHCNKTGHTRDHCWKLHGRPANMKQKSKGESKGFTVNQSSDTSDALKHDEIAVLRRILDKYSSEQPSEQSTPSVTLAHAGMTLFTAMSAVTKSKNIWVVDSGATDHITGCRELFVDFSPKSEHAKVQVANNTYAKVMGSGKIRLSEHIILDNVLYVPDIKCNLLSVRCLAHKLNCLVIFDESACGFQDIALGKVIGKAK